MKLSVNLNAPILIAVAGIILLFTSGWFPAQHAVGLVLLLIGGIGIVLGFLFLFIAATIIAKRGQ